MSLFKRMTNLAKGTLATAGPDRGSDALETLLQEQALEQELAKPPAPSDAAREALADLKAGRGAAAAAAPSSTSPSSTSALDVELARLQKARDEGVLNDEELERKAAEAVARAEAARGADLPPPERPIKKTL